MPECLLRVDWIDIMEVVPIELVVASFPIALDVGLAWPHRAPVPWPLRLGVLMHEGGRGNQQVQRAV
jgi:hypothetical protein